MRRKTKLELKGQDQPVKAASAAVISAVIHDNQPGSSPSSAPSADPVGRFGARIKLARKSVTRFAKKELVQTGQKVAGRIKSYHVFRGSGCITLLENENRGGESDVVFRSKDLNEESVAGARKQAGKLSKGITLKLGQVVQFDLFEDTLARKFYAKDISGENGGLLEPEEAWVVKTDRDNLSKEVLKLREDIKKLNVKKSEEERGLCILCRNEPANMMFVPCNHVVACEQCYKANIGMFQSKCMMCRAPVGEPGTPIRKVFLP